MELITNRTASDVGMAKSLLDKGWYNMTETEREEFISGMIGAYNHTDLNRVESAVQFVNDYLNSMQGGLDTYREAQLVASDPFWLVPFAYPVTFETKTDWAVSDLPSVSDLERYLRNVSELTERIPIVKNLPSTMDRLTIEGANEIERAILVEYDAGQNYEAGTKRLIDNTVKSFVYSGEIFGGEL